MKIHKPRNWFSFAIKLLLRICKAFLITSIFLNSQISTLFHLRIMSACSHKYLKHFPRENQCSRSSKQLQAPWRDVPPKHLGGTFLQSTLEGHPSKAPWGDVLQNNLGGTSLQTTLEGHPSKQPWRDIPPKLVERIPPKCGEGFSLQTWRDVPPSLEGIPSKLAITKFGGTDSAAVPRRANPIFSPHQI